MNNNSTVPRTLNSGCLTINILGLYDKINWYHLEYVMGLLEVFTAGTQDLECILGSRPRFKGPQTHTSLEIKIICGV